MVYSSDMDDDYLADADDETPTVTCPHCKAEVYEEADSCPSCGEFLIDGGHAALQAKPWWFLALGLLGVVAVLLVLSGLVKLL